MLVVAVSFCFFFKLRRIPLIFLTLCSRSNQNNPGGVPTLFIFTSQSSAIFHPSSLLYFLFLLTSSQTGLKILLYHTFSPPLSFFLPLSPCLSLYIPLSPCLSVFVPLSPSPSLWFIDFLQLYSLSGLLCVSLSTANSISVLLWEQRGVPPTLL